MTPEPTDKLDTAVAAVNGPEDGILDWQAIDWRAVEDDVRRLRQRIFTASQAGDLKRELTNRRRLRLPVSEVVQDINTFLYGWTGYFRYGHSAERFSKIRQYVRTRIALFISKRHRRSRHYGTWALLNYTPDEFGLISLYGIVISPRAGKPWRERPNAGGERRR